MSKKKPKILVCPLDWGIGHATRCVPIIRHLLEINCEVVIAAGGFPLAFLQTHFPGLPSINFPGTRIRYAGNHRLFPAMARQIPRIMFGIFQEHRQLQRIIRREAIDAVISDNRFGLWSKHAWSVYITHQLMIKAPAGLKGTEPLLHKIHGWFISRYRECWVPDVPGPLNLSGDLSHRYSLPENGYFIGPLSRFEKPDRDTSPFANGPRWLFLISGPEPQRTLFENIIRKELERGFDGEAIILQGLPGNAPATGSITGVKTFPHLPDPELRDLILSAGTIICRPGYSTLMDLAALGRTALLVPTPGQTEQEYLAHHAAETGSFRIMTQENLKLELIPDLPNTDVTTLPESNGSLREEAIDRLVRQLSCD